ncbi:hypothetical protein BGZ74_011245, partial [Mortierella antarctica]
MDTTTLRSTLLSSVPTEIFELILSNLDLPSLAVCVRVNRAWNELCIPHLWRTLNIDSGERLERFMTDATQMALSRNAEYIQELTLKYMSIYNIFAPAVDGSGSTHTTINVGIPQCTNLRRLDLLLYDDPKRRPNGHWDYEQPPIFDNPLDSVLDEAVALLIRRNPGLTVLVIEKSTCFKTLLPLLVNDLPHLEELHCSTNCSIDEHLAKVLLEHLPERTRSEAFSRLGIFLRSLHPTDLEHGSASSDAEIAEYICLSTHWETIHLQDCRSAGPLTVAA